MAAVAPSSWRVPIARTASSDPSSTTSDRITSAKIRAAGARPVNVPPSPSNIPWLLIRPWLSADPGPELKPCFPGTSRGQAIAGSLPLRTPIA